MPGWFSVGLIIALLVLVTLLAGKVLSQSTPLAITAVVIVIVATVAIDAVLGSLLARLRMPRISIEQVPGQVTWNSNRYAAVAGGRALEPISDAFNMQPGDYTFYVLKGTKYLLSTYYQVNQYSLEVSRYAYDALIEGSYRVYFLPNTKILVNIDPRPDFSS